MSLLPEELVRQIHASAGEVVLVLNGGSRAVAELLEVPGASKTIREAAVPYSEEALRAWLGCRPEQSCSSRTARAMAVVAFDRARQYGAAEASAAGIAASASLASDRPKRGDHRAHVACQTAVRTVCWSLELEKGARSRAEEEAIVCRMVLNAVAEACGIEERLFLPLANAEHVEMEQATAPASWQDLFLGRAELIRARGACSSGLSRNSGREPAEGGSTNAVFPGAFNPLHVGHCRMAEVAAEILSRPVEFEISVVNVAKPPLDYLEIERRVAQFPAEQAIWLTRAATFEEKSRLFPGATFVVGADTLERIVDPRYYGNQGFAMHPAIERIVARNCRFLVFGRTAATGFRRLGDVSLPFGLRRACIEVPPEKYREDVSSTELRKERS